MDVILYRKLYLSENWGFNCFSQIKKNGFRRLKIWYLTQTNEEGFWINDHELCVGYELRSNPAIFRPVFSHKRQRLLDVVHTDIVRPSQFWRTVRMRYWQALCKIKHLPLECVDHVVRFIY
jgi:hypothetical protein